ncbi:hypothetical protein OAW78_00340 [Schleiferiaceae bacterium]|nr:hypothetical protein [Schleiferiaceae bacterium]
MRCILSTYCLVLSLCSHSGFAQHVLFYNVENLFDTLHDRGKNDFDFTPNGTYSYASSTYFLKIRQTARALRSAMNTTDHTIDIIAVAEVENRSVLLDLAKHKAIKNFGPWQIVHFDSPDHRGIDCAALINLSTSRVIRSKPITYSSRHYKTRDALLLVTRSASQKDSIDLTSVIVHLPSKRGGAFKSAPFREMALSAVLAELDCDSAQNQLIVGDFNDLSTADYFQNIMDSGWTAPGFSHPKNINGTYKFQGRWQHIDLALYRGKRTYLGRIIGPQLLLESDTKWGGYKPKRAFLGTFYTYGYSDHLPVYIFNVND